MSQCRAAVLIIFSKINKQAAATEVALIIALEKEGTTSRCSSWIRMTATAAAKLTK